MQVHRQLLAALGEEDSSLLLANKELQEVAEHINNKHRVGRVPECVQTSVAELTVRCKTSG